ncbi:MAG: hypothetical protein U1E65_11810 [Myxococcota bacterium]
MEPGTTAVGPYQLRLPAFWRSTSVREKPPLFASSSVVSPGVSFDFSVLVGLGADTAEEERALAAILDAHGGRTTAIEEQYHGMEIRGHRMVDLPELGPGSVRELMTLRAYGDLLIFGYILSSAAEEESWRMLFLTLVEGAVVDRGYALNPG